MIFHDWEATDIIPSPDVWYQYQQGGSGHHVIYDSSGNERTLLGNESLAPVLTENVLAGHPAWYFDGTKDPLVYTGLITLKHVFILASNEDATFDGFQGLLTGPTSGDVLVGDAGETTFFDLGIGNLYSSAGTAYDEDNQQAPMSGTFRLLEVKNADGITLDGIQIGQQKADVTRRWKGHFVEMIGFTSSLTSAEIRQIRLYFNIKFGEWRRGLPLYFPTADIVPVVGPSRFYDVPQDYKEITDTWQYEDATRDFNEVADDAPRRWEYNYSGVPKAQKIIFDEFWRQARLVNTFNFKDPEGVVWDNVRVEEYNRNHPGHMRWRHEAQYNLVGYNSTGTQEFPAGLEDAPTGLALSLSTETSLIASWDDPIAPSIPVMTAATDIEIDSITWNWNAATDNVAVTTYDLQVATDAGFTTDLRTIPLGNVLTYIDTGRTGSTQYYARVRAGDAAGNHSAYSSSVNATTDAAPAVGLIANTGAGSTDGGGVTSSAIDTTGADLIVISVALYKGFAGTLTLSDSEANTWTSMSTSTFANNIQVLTFRCATPTTDAAHTFTVVPNTGGSAFPSIFISAWENTGAFEDESTNETAPATTIQAGSATPGAALSLFIASLAGNGLASVTSIGSGFTVLDTVASVGGQHVFGSMAYKIQSGSAAAEDPLWTVPGGGTEGIAAAIAVFDPA